MAGRRGRDGVILLLFAIAFTTLAVWSGLGESATFDEPLNITAGYAALTRHDFRLDPEHPPWLREWAALPLAAMRALRFDDTSAEWSPSGEWHFARQFLYQPGAGDGALARARFMVVLLGVLLGVLVFLWTRARFGSASATIVLAFYTTEPNLLAHASLATTDLGITLFFFAALYFLWRTVRAITVANVAGFLAAAALAFGTKNSALLLIPTTFVLLVASALGQRPWPCRIGHPRFLATRRRRLAAAAAILALMLIAAYGSVWAAYDFRYAPIAHQPSPFNAAGRTGLRGLASPLSALLGWIDAHHLLPGAYAEGFRMKVGEIGAQAAYLAGRYADHGWWYFFPLAFLVKTPTAILLLSLAGLVLALRRWRVVGGDDLFLWFPAAFYVAASMPAGADLGVRYILPVYPLILVGSGAAVAAALAAPRRRLRGALAALCALQLAEFALVFPHDLAFFNLVAGGPRNGAHWLVDSSLDWGQDLKSLSRWMKSHGIRDINLSYFGTAEPGYYGMTCHYLPGAPLFADRPLAQPVLPGYVAISVTNLEGVYLGEMRDFYRPFRTMKPVAVLGYSIRVYYVDHKWY